MSARVRRGLLVIFGGALLALLTAYFGAECLAGLARLDGQRAYYTGDFTVAWNSYGRALRLGGSREGLEVDRAETLLFGLDQQVLGVKVTLPMAASDAVVTLRDLLARRLAYTPYRAYYWSLVSDLYLYEARSARRSSALDLSSLSDDPVQNLRPEEGLALAALEEAARREPANYIYQDLLAEQFLEWGVVDRAIPHVRRGVALYPVRNGHTYLGNEPIRPEVVEAALAGFEDALGSESMVPKEEIECDAGALLVSQGENAKALTYFKRALQRAPNMPDALYHYGQACYLMGDYATADDAMTRASANMPDTASLFYYLGLARLKEGKTPEAIEALQTAREIDPRGIELFQTLAQVLEDAGQTKDAERQLTAAAHLNPDRPEAWSALLAFYGRHRDLRTDARRICNHLETMKIDPKVYKSACDDLLRVAP
jgi:tetratricopeptide (TPR) repeat protein